MASKKNEAPGKPSQEASSNPEHRRPTIKSMKHKVFKTFGLEKSTSSTQAVAEDQESAGNDDGVSNSSNLIAELKTSPGDKRKQFEMPSRTESKSEPTLVTDTSFSPDDEGVKQKDLISVVADHPHTPSETSSVEQSSPLSLVSFYVVVPVISVCVWDL